MHDGYLTDEEWRRAYWFKLPLTYSRPMTGWEILKGLVAFFIVFPIVLFLVAALIVLLMVAIMVPPVGLALVARN